MDLLDYAGQGDKPCPGIKYKKSSSESFAATEQCQRCLYNFHFRAVARVLLQLRKNKVSVLFCAASCLAPAKAGHGNALHKVALGKDKEQHNRDGHKGAGGKYQFPTGPE